MKRKIKQDLLRLNEELKEQYHELSRILVMGNDERGTDVRTDKLKAAFVLMDLAICEVNEVLGRNRSD